MTEQPATCDATKNGDTATGPVTVRCTKTPGHIERGDHRHEGRTGEAPGMPVYCTDQQLTGH